MAALTLYLVRHPEPEIAPGICYGRLDVPAKNVMVAVEGLRTELPPDLPVWTSPLRRCTVLAEMLHPAPIIDERLIEMDFGVWEGRSWDTISRLEIDAWATDVAGYAPPGGESPLGVQRRVISFVSTLTVDRAIVVTHAGVIRTLLAAQYGLPSARWCELIFPYASVTVVTLEQ